MLPPGRRPKGDREVPDTAQAARRFIRALGRKVGNADPEDLIYLTNLRDELEAAIATAVDGLRTNSTRSDMEIARALGVSRQAVGQRYPRTDDMPRPLNQYAVRH